ncbi:MAG: hypothetical protein ACXAEN_22560 [Candidatus Thorarchaeota archaeon]|jgi:hypothetical protein
MEMLPEWRVVLEVADEEVYYVIAGSKEAAETVVREVAEQDGLDVIGVRAVEIAEPPHENTQDQ